MFTSEQALEAIKARITGDFDNEQLKRYGFLSTDKLQDIKNIAELGTIRTAQQNYAYPEDKVIADNTVGEQRLLAMSLIGAIIPLESFLRTASAQNSVKTLWSCYTIADLKTKLKTLTEMIDGIF